MRVVYLAADPITAYLIVRDGVIPGTELLLAVSARRSALPAGTGVQLTVPADAVSRDSDGQLRVQRSAITPSTITRSFQPWHVEVEPEHQRRWSTYLDPEYNLTLLNLVGAITPGELERKEAILVEARYAELEPRPVAATFDLAHLQAIHRTLFQDVYPFAGELRTVNMQRPGGPPFMHWEDLPEALNHITAAVRAHDIASLDQEAFVEVAAPTYNAINTAHPFREGNGRSQRAWFNDLARVAGLTINWSAVRGGINDLASQQAREGNLEPLRAMLRSITAPRPPQLPAGITHLTDALNHRRTAPAPPTPSATHSPTRPAPPLDLT